MTTAEQTGTVYLVGAGPGDPELLTLKAHRLLSQCDALVYDSLVPKEVLDLVPASCERRFVGKRRGHHSVPQPSTNAVLVEMAQMHSTVVRLKGGDPFLFGRGGEEAAYLAERNIPVQVVPGVTAGIAAPAYAGIPVTPAFAPGTGTPEIAGMTTREMVNVLRGLSGLNLVSADVVEVSPAYDHAEVTSLAAATIVYELTNLFAKS